MTWISQSRSTFRAADLGACGRLDAVEPASSAGQSLQTSADDGGFLEPLLADEPGQPGLHPAHRRPHVNRQGGAYRINNLAVAISRNGPVTWRHAATHAGQGAG